ncbi:hypothetical protein [Mesorhizobium sp. CAU 1732]|uniref:hypothetical protein n=1 Tax=Mesorhizobium sp. CAU 1732 TaxID=3140358 RepID=UPI0032606495
MDVRTVVSGHVHMTASGTYRGIPFSNFAGNPYSIEPTLQSPSGNLRRSLVPAFPLGTPPTSPDWNVGGDIEIGVTGPGALSIEGGGTVTTTVGVLGLTSASTGTAMVTDPGSTWSNSDVLIVGVQGSGTLIIEEGGAVSNTDAYIGHASVAGTATVTGAGSVWANSEAWTLSGRP